MKILITGGAGYIGSLLTQALLDQDYHVTVLDNFMYSYEPIIHLLDYKKLQIIKDDIRNDLTKYLKKYDVIYHLAGLSGYPACEANPHSAELINVAATRDLVNKLSKDQIIIYASTTSFYGKSGKIMDEKSKIDIEGLSDSLYNATKYKAEQIVMQKENAISLRFATIFGVSPRMRVDLLVNDFTYKAVNDRCVVLFEGKTKRTFLHIKDAISAYIMIIKNLDLMKNGIFNVGSDEMNYTKLNIAERIKKYTNYTIIDSEIKDLDLRNFVISFKKIDALGYKVHFTLDDGIKELIRLYRFYKPFLPYKTI